MSGVVLEGKELETRLNSYEQGGADLIESIITDRKFE